MKKKHVIILLLSVGIFLILGSVAFAVVSTASKDIIGGADFPTFRYVFLYENRGLYSTLTLFGIVLVIASFVIKRKK